MTSAITFEGVSYRAGGREILSSFTLAAAPGETVVLLGRSGSGKTTALRMVNAMVEPLNGVVRVLGRETRDWDRVRLRRSIGYVIQEVGLLPHLTVAENVNLVPRLEGRPRMETEDRVRRLLHDMGLRYEIHAARRPRELSGGERQRVGIARALAADPPILLLDEPFGALDPVTRHDLQTHFLDLQHRLRKTCIFVTHDVAEALRLADRIALLEGGSVSLFASPEQFSAATHPEAALFLKTLPGAAG